MSAPQRLFQLIQTNMIGHHHMRISANMKVLGRDALLLQHVQLLYQSWRIDDHPMAENGGHLGARDTSRNLVQLEHRIADHHRMAGVIPPLITNHHCGPLRQVVDNFALSFITPLGPNDHYCRHSSPFHWPGGKPFHKHFPYLALKI